MYYIIVLLNTHHTHTSAPAGTTPRHVELERLVAEFLGKEVGGVSGDLGILVSGQGWMDAWEGVRATS